MTERVRGRSDLDVLGMAPGSAEGDDGRFVYIFGQAAIQSAREQSWADTAVILGCAMAHEIGHLLLHGGHHSEAGIMQGRWHAGSALLMAQNSLVFHPREAEMIRQELARRCSNQAVEELSTAR
jgi:hypothetical protein